MASKTEFKRGQRVRYVGNLVPSFTGKLGTIISLSKSGIKVRFDEWPLSSFSCFSCNLERIVK